MMCAESTPLRPHPDVVFTGLGREKGALLHLGTKRYYTLNATGLLIWELLDAGEDEQTIVEKLSQEFEVDTEGSTRSVAAFLGDLSREGLLQS